MTRSALPVSKQDSPRPATASLGINHNKMNILVVDDDPTLRFILEGTLTKLGHQVTITRDGLEALRFFEKGIVPLVISDMLMPVMDGLELCRRIRQANRSHYTYVILLTMVQGKAGYLDGMQAGADDFLT